MYEAETIDYYSADREERYYATLYWSIKRIQLEVKGNERAISIADLILDNPPR